MNHLLHHYLSIANREHKILPHHVKVGSVTIGSKETRPVQSMTNTDTNDAGETAQQVLRIADAGGKLVRITAQGPREAENLAQIKALIKKTGRNIPLVADVHFSPKVAETAAAIVDKVRINPGNFAEKRARFKQVELSEEDYQKELERTEETLKPLLQICKRKGTALRIGANHGSLSDRIITRYGDTPEGMVESVMEFVAICEKHHFHDIVISLKSSNTKVMVQANRLMAARMQEHGRAYPLHLGVTEAGEGEDGRLRSAVGIGSLLADSIGETIRVSLSEAPEKEIPVALELTRHFFTKPFTPLPKKALCYPPFSFIQRHTRNIPGIDAADHPVAVVDICGSNTDRSIKELVNGNPVPDFIYTGTAPFSQNPVQGKRIIRDATAWEGHSYTYPFFSFASFLQSSSASSELNFIEVEAIDTLNPAFNAVIKDKRTVLIVKAGSDVPVNTVRNIFCKLDQQKCDVPVVLKASYPQAETGGFQIKAASDAGVHFIDGLANGLMLSINEKVACSVVNSALFGILQASGARLTRTEYISCPSCGRTLFNLEETVARIREQTAHLKGIKIAVMGCIVNGPGEMADADYGYVGAAPGKITLYKNRQVMKNNIPEKQAVNELIALIKKEGDWKEAAT